MKQGSVFHVSAATLCLALAISVLASCATLDEGQCLSVDWQALGHEDGAAGRPVSHIERHREACTRHRLPVQDEPWRAGWTAGIQLYCTPQNGLSVGRAGSHYANSCPPELKAGFENAYLVGRRVRDAQAALDSARSELNAAMEKRLKAATDAEKTALDREILIRQSDSFAAQSRLLSAEAAYDRYLGGLGRDL